MVKCNGIYVENVREMCSLNKGYEKIFNIYFIASTA